MRKKPLDGHLPEKLTIEAKTKLGEARFHVLSKGLEFCRVVYGSDYSKIVILVVYVCRHCGCAPACDFDWWRVGGSGKLKGWYSACCGEKYEQDLMSGVLVVYRRERRDLSFAREIEIPNWKGANVLSFLKWFNALRTGNMRLSTDALEGRLEDFLINLRDMIARDNRISTRVFDAVKVLKIT